ncbi:MAG: hypothetical protein GY807_16310 [Gammaproteobacteria bacterium]|nr:hypothetical protein [Gammaproteobacteria bacterium]
MSLAPSAGLVEKASTTDWPINTLDPLAESARPRCLCSGRIKRRLARYRPHALQAQLGLGAHPGAITAFELCGYAQYLALGGREVVLFAKAKTKLPS